MVHPIGPIRSVWGRGEHRQLEVERMLGLVQNASQEIKNTTFKIFSFFPHKVHGLVSLHHSPFSWPGASMFSVPATIIIR